MQHFLIEVNYRAPRAQIDNSGAAHRAYLLIGIRQGLILCAGPRQLDEGDFIIARADSQASLEAFFAFDPYVRDGLADYRYRPFTPQQFDSALADWSGPA